MILCNYRTAKAPLIGPGFIPCCTFFENSIESQTTAFIVLSFILAAYATERIQQFTRDARSVMGTDKHDKKRR